MNTVAFDISSALYTEGGAKAMTPDANGVYKNMPVMVLGKTSRNHKNYDVDSMVYAITNRNSAFYKKLKAGQLQGEYGHPLVTKEEDVARIAFVEPTRVSHLIHKVYCGRTTEQGHTIVYADIEPFGPYGPFLDASFKNPRSNTAFSLRSLVAQTGVAPDGSLNQRVTALITIDYVDAPGYAEASKVNVSTEGMNIPVKDIVKNKQLLSTVVGCESVNDQELLDMLQVDKVTVMRNVSGILDINGRYIDTGDGKFSVFHKVFLKEK